MGRPKINIQGQRFGKLYVLYEDVENTKRDTYWICECDCGETRSFNGNRLRSGKTKSCGCRIYERPPTKPKEYTEDDFENFIPLERTDKINNHCYVWRFKCKNCGNDEYYAVPSKIKNGRFCNLCKNETTTKHGMYKTRLYRILAGMKRRCYIEDDKSYKHYGEKGISICEEWLNDKDGFTNFYNWAYENGYNENLTIERIDVEGDYCPENCEWTTMFKQQQNRNDNVYFKAVSPSGEVTYGKCLTEFSRHIGLTKDMIFNYLRGKQKTCHGWHFERVSKEVVNESNSD